MKLSKMSAQTKLLIVAVLVILIGVGYYLLVYKGYNDKEAELKSSITATQSQIDAENTKIAGINKLKKSIEEGKTLGSIVYPKDNSNAESAFLSSVLKRNSLSSSYNFGEGKAGDTYIRRNVSVNFTASNYQNARAILDEIADSEYRNIISNVSLSASGNNGFSGENAVSCSFTVTFIESVKDTTPAETAEETK